MPCMTDQQERALAAGLTALAATTRCAGASDRVRQAVMAAARAGHEERRPPERGRGRTSAGLRFTYAAAAVLVMTSLSGAWLAHRAARTAYTIRPTGFVQIPGADVLPPIESGVIVRVALPLTILPLYGLTIPPEGTIDAVDADLLVAQDGIPRAIRLPGAPANSRSTPLNPRSTP
ncbi:MAG TPA: hypothetical protein VM364_20235 [Vicinamibacterales bacterium]|nr:hypothetical protein [Vicinamibacterales bacterium]